MTSDSADAHKAAGNAAFAAKNYDEAIAAFSMAIKLRPDDHILHSNRSGAYAAMGDYEQALKDAETCVALAPQWAKGYSRLGCALLALDRVQEAAKAYTKGMSLDHSNSACLQGFQQCITRMATSGPPPQQSGGHAGGAPPRPSSAAQHEFLEHFKDNPEIMKDIESDPSFLDRVSEALMESILMQQQQASAQTMREPEDPKVARAMRYLMLKFEMERQAAEEKKRDAELERTRRRQQEQEAAERAAKDAAMSNEQREAAELKDQGNALYKARRFDEAVAKYEQAAAIYPADLTFRCNKATALLEKGDIDACLAELDSALEQRTTVEASFEVVAKLYAKKGAAYMRRKNYAAAVEAYERSLLEHNTRQVRAAMADAKRALEKAEREALIDPVKADEYRAEGNRLFQQGEHAAAKEMYDKAVVHGPDDARIYANRAAALLSLLALPEALKDCEKSLELDPKVAKIWARKGTVLMMMKDYNKAMVAFQKGLDLDPQNVQCLQGLQQVQMKVAMSCQTTEVDEEQVKRAMADPEIQLILSDPQFRLTLQALQEDPARAAAALQDPTVAVKLQKLAAAGILKLG